MESSLNQNKSIERRSARAGLMLVIVAAVTLEATSLVQNYFAQKGLHEEASMRAAGQLQAARNRIMDVVDQTESAVRNNKWIAEWCLNLQDSLPRVPEKIVMDNPVVVGSTIALVPGYSKTHPLYAPYAFGDSTGRVSLLSLATEQYDYPSQEWFTEPLARGEGYWSEPYIDEGGGDILMTTFSVPVMDAEGTQAAVLTADIALDWLTELLGNIQIYPHAVSMIISRGGNLMGSEERLVKVAEVVRVNESFDELDRAMRAGESGSVIIKYQGQKFHTFYAPVERTGWYMCIVIPQEDIFGGIRRLSGLVLLLQILGIALLIIILHSFVKGQLKYKKLNEKRERMEGELHIASGIQMSMVPKVFPPFPERHDLDMAADLVPAKEVGGDLYDYYIRDGKLFFCIGDVSGKGIPASLVMAVTRTTFRNVSAKEDSPGMIVSAMNDNLSAMNESSMFVTFFCGVLDLAEGRLRYCNAGHNPPLLLTDAMRMLPVEPNLPLGIMPGMEFVEQEIDFRYDDAIFLYTDGVTEAENTVHEQFGEDRMKKALHGRKGAYAHLQNIEQKVKEFVGEAPQSDDLTLLFIHYLGREPEVHKLHLILHNDIRQISRLEGWLDSVSGTLGIDQTLVPGINLALEEAATNVIDYAYPEGTYGCVELEASRDGDNVRFVLTDSGKAFDPTAQPPVDITASAEDRRIGGLGIHLVREIMDQVMYEYKDGKNILTMIKKI